MTGAHFGHGITLGRKQNRPFPDTRMIYRTYV